MAEFKHLVVVKFKEGVNVDEIVEQVEKMVSDIDSVKSFEWYFSGFKSPFSPPLMHTIPVNPCYI